MDGTIDFIILEHDDVAGCALIAGAVDGVVPAIDGYNTPYVVAKGYDHATRNWEDCTLFDDIVKAKLAYEGLRGWEYSLDGNMRRDDSATSDIRGFTDAELAIEIEKAGAAMVEHVDAHMAHVRDLGLGSSQADNFYRGVYDVTAHHNSMFWPSGDGNAVHVSHCRLGDGPSFGLTVRTIPAAAIVNEPVTFEKIDRLGGKIELCVDGIDADIGKVRAFASSSPVVRAFVDPLCAYIPAPSDSVREQERDISPYLRQTAQRCQRISHPIDPPETASAAARATFGGAAARPAYRGHKNQ
ncbi:hypothetical protein [Eggerthella lenta]|uniref:hypothetical protein n=1 Tax=Eggerthella lenta TaxID=84112 RepID=UPI001F218072|nr:hypothetical protein [Eggerthella lenta]